MDSNILPLLFFFIRRGKTSVPVRCYSNYLVYLKSRKWSRLRRLVRARSNGICQCCKRLEIQRIHHLTYINLFSELLEDLLGVCKRCHKLLHKEFKYFSFTLPFFTVCDGYELLTDLRFPIKKFALGPGM